jgi:HK97 family phage prohead protease
VSKPGCSWKTVQVLPFIKGKEKIMQLGKGSFSKSMGDPQADKFIIQGTMSKEILDLENDMISARAYDDAVNTVKSRAASENHVPVFIEHRRKETLPVGRVIDAWKEGNELKFKAEIAKGTLGDPIRELIEQGYLSHCSIGGDATKSHKQYDQSIGKEARVIDSFQLRELSLTALPVLPDARFALAKSLGKQTLEVQTLVEKLDKAIDSIAGQKKIDHELSMLKAIDPSTLDDAGLQKIKESLDNLANLLGIDTTTETATGVTDSATTDNTSSQNPNLSAGQESSESSESSESLESQDSQEFSDSVDDDIKDANLESSESQTEVGSDLPEPPDSVSSQYPGSQQQQPPTDLEAKLDEVNQKLDRLLGESGDEQESQDSQEFSESRGSQGSQKQPVDTTDGDENDENDDDDDVTSGSQNPKKFKKSFLPILKK